MYVITPAAQISTLRPYLQTKKLTLITTINNNNNNKFLVLKYAHIHSFKLPSKNRWLPIFKKKKKKKVQKQCYGKI